MIEFSVNFKREIFKASIEDGQTLGDLKEAFYLLTKVAPSMQKLFHKGIKFPSLDDSTKVETFSEAIRKDPKVTLIGTTEVDFKKIEEKNVQLEERKAFKLKPAKPYQEPVAITNITHTFHSIEVLQEFHYIDQPRARDILHRLRADTGIVALMKEYKWSIGKLIEICPIRQPTILGYNRNRGEVIALRLRTNDLTGFRHYNDVKKVLIHELTHMVHSEHNHEFWSLNRRLNQEVISRDWTKVGGRVLSSSDFFTPTATDGKSTGNVKYQGGAFFLGGEGKQSVKVNFDSEDLTQDEKDMAGSCGTS